MKIITMALALGVLALCTVDSAADAKTRRVWIYTPRGSCGPPDYTIVPRYCYDPRDDRVDTSPYAKPVAPVYGLQYGGPSGW
ncbi:MAG TPA: hypothetical protein VFL62_03935 [Bradyrhizobium sp.]|nr:hypothetical protein [Bradyrhizobium sp.]